LASSVGGRAALGAARTSLPGDPVARYDPPMGPSDREGTAGDANQARARRDGAAPRWLRAGAPAPG